jgi:hypothetical protein
VRASIWWLTYLESVKLDIGIAMRKTSDNALNGLLRTIWIVAYFVADLDNSAPILRGEVLVGSLCYAGVSHKNSHIETHASHNKLARSVRYKWKAHNILTASS